MHAAEGMVGMAQQSENARRTQARTTDARERRAAWNSRNYSAEEASNDQQKTIADGPEFQILILTMSSGLKPAVMSACVK
jgi:hypothetical protein